ncbi:MAG: DUF424 family protein [Nanoarchaeota archaeon]
MILVKIHRGPCAVVAICDKNLIGRTFSEKNFEIKITEHFYRGESRNHYEVEKIMKEYDNLNIVGNESIKLAIKCGAVNKENVLVIRGVPHAQKVSF